jgi:hypothetical protein
MALAVAALVSTSSDAFADIVTETFTGTARGTDTAGYFGTPGAYLPGTTTYTATYVFNTNLPGAFNYFDNGGNIFFARGGTFYSAPTPSISASLTINGHTFTEIDAGSYVGDLVTSDLSFGHFETTGGASVANGQNFYNDIYTQDPSAPVPTSLNSPFSYNYNPVGSAGNDGAFSIGGDNLTFLPSTVVLADAVPELSTWAMMVLGFCALGLLAYRRKKRRAPLRLIAKHHQVMQGRPLPDSLFPVHIPIDATPA